MSDRSQRSELPAWHSDRESLPTPAFGTGGLSSGSQLVSYASTLVHEACHVRRYSDGLVSGGVVRETACMYDELDVLADIDPNDDTRLQAWVQDVIDNIDDPATWWWELAQGRRW